MEDSYQRLCQNDQYELRYMNQANWLTLQIFYNQMHKNIQVYMTKIIYLENQKLHKFFDSIDQVLQHLKNPFNFSIDLVNRVFIITEKVQRNRTIELVQFQLQHIQSIPKTIDYISKLMLEKCKNKVLTQHDTKQMFELIALGFEQIHTEKHSQKQLNSAPKDKASISKKNLKNSTYDNQAQDAKQDYGRNNNQDFMKIAQLENQYKILQNDLKLIDSQVTELRAKLSTIQSHNNNKNQVESKIRQEISNQKQMISAANDEISILKQRPADIPNKRYLTRNSGKRVEKKICKQQELESKKIEHIKIQLPTFMPAGDFIDASCADYKKLTVNSTKIIAKQCSLIFGKTPVKNHGQFSVNVIKMKKYMGLGIADSRYKSHAYLYESPNVVRYFSSKNCRIGKQSKYYEGQGFYQKQIVTVRVNFETQMIQWRVGTQIRNQVKWSLLKDRSISWVPLIDLLQDDQIEIVK